MRQYIGNACEILWVLPFRAWEKLLSPASSAVEQKLIWIDESGYPWNKNIGLLKVKNCCPTLEYVRAWASQKIKFFNSLY